MITNEIARNEIRARIISAKNGKRRGNGSAFRSDKWAALAGGERMVGIVGGSANSAVFSPACSRDDKSFGTRILYFGANKTLVHEELAEGDALVWFNAAYARAA